MTFILLYRCQNTRESQFEGGHKHKVDIFIVHKWDFLDKRRISKRCLPFVWPWCWPAFGMRGMHKPEPLQLNVDSLCLCTGQRLWDNNLRSVANSCFDTSTCAGAETTACWKKQTHKRRNMPTVAPSAPDTHVHKHTHAHTHRGTHTLPPTCLLASVLWLITVLVSVSVSWHSVFIQTLSFLLQVGTGSLLSSQERSHGWEKSKKEKKGCYVLMRCFGGGVGATLPKTSHLSLYFLFKLWLLLHFMLTIAFFYLWLWRTVCRRKWYLMYYWRT